MIELLVSIYLGIALVMGLSINTYIPLAVTRREQAKCAAFCGILWPVAVCWLIYVFYELWSDL